MWSQSAHDQASLREISGAVHDAYRVVAHGPTRADEFVPAYFNQPTRARQEFERRNRSACETMGLSVYTDREDAVWCSRAWPRLGSLIAEIRPERGASVIMPTSGIRVSHHTWWVGMEHLAERMVQSVERA
jgi:hypothetical protein